MDNQHYEDPELMAEAGGAGMHNNNGGSDVIDPPEEEPTGYKRPPKKHQFKPGRSGNPKGRPKSAVGLRKILKRELSAKVAIREGGKTLSLSKLQAVVKRLVEKAMNGDQRAIEHLVNLNISIFGLGNDGPSESSALTPGEEAFLDAMMRRMPGSDEDAGFEGDPDAVSDNENEETDDAN